MLMFWTAAAVISAISGSLILRFAAMTQLTTQEDPAVRVHRTHLDDLTDLAGRGLLDPAEFSAARAEAARRLLAAHDRSPGGTPLPGGRRTAVIAAMVLPILGAGVYLLTGVPGLPDQPLAQRISHWAAHPDDLTPEQIAVVMETVVAGRPTDVDALKNLAIARMMANDSTGAESAARRALAQAPARPDLADLLQRIIALASQGAAAAPPASPAEMVERLAVRLRADPDNPEGWVRLVRGYNVLGEAAKRDQALKIARSRYANRPDVLSALQSAASPVR